MSEPEKEVTIYDIAKRLNISAATVSRGLKDHPGINKNTKKKILNAASEMGYRSNSFRQQSSQKTKQYNWCNSTTVKQQFYVGCDCRH